MRALLTYGSLLIVLAVVALAVRNQLHAGRGQPAPAQASSAPFAGSSSPTEAQFKAELDKALSQGAARRADEAASAEDGAR